MINAWNATPFVRRLAILCETVLEGQRTIEAISKLLAIVVVLASHLNSEARVAIADQSRREAALLGTTLH
jgi:hypothetical protein